jgi:predicted phosphate transport protein (TIGR00153 family)
MRLSLPSFTRPKLSLLPRENKFFFLLHQGSLNIQKTAGRLQNLVDEFDNVPAKVQEIKDLEEVGDRIIYDITRALYRTFVTPIDREDILALAGSFDDVVDAIDEAAQYLLEYQIEEPTESARQLASVIVRCADQLEGAIALLSTRGSKLRDILPMTEEINRLEHEADRIASVARSELFNDNFETKQILKWRDIYDDLEQATDRAEDAADILEGIVLKHS